MVCNAMNTGNKEGGRNRYKFMNISSHTHTHTFSHSLCLSYSFSFCTSYSSISLVFVLVLVLDLIFPVAGYQYSNTADSGWRYSCRYEHYSILPCFFLSPFSKLIIPTLQQSRIHALVFSSTDLFLILQFLEKCRLPFPC